MKQVKITVKQYLELKKLAVACSYDFSRIALTKVFYNKEFDEFAACDGHVLRIHKIEWADSAPEHSFMLEYREIMYSERQLFHINSEPDDIFNRKRFVSNALVPINYREVASGCAYPDYRKLIPKQEDRKPLDQVGMNYSIIKKFFDSFVSIPSNARFSFSGQLAAVVVDIQQHRECEWVLGGVIMPTRI